jgi:hypothetical protein
MLTVTEWEKLNPTPLSSGVVEIFARENPVLAAMPFQNIAGNSYRYNIEQTLPGVAFRDIGEGYTESTGVINPATEALRILGGDSDYDTAQIAMGIGGNDTRAVHDAMKSKALSLTWLDTFFHGDNTANPKEFDGRANRLTGNQVMYAGVNGAQLTMDLLDDLIDAVNGEPSVLLCAKPVRRAITKLARNSSNLTWTVDQFGRQIAVYAGVPIGIIEEGVDGNAILGFDETRGTSDVTGSIYAARFGPDMLSGIQTAAISVRDLGEIDAKPALRTRIEWFSGMVLKHPRCAARLAGVLAPA